MKLQNHETPFTILHDHNFNGLRRGMLNGIGVDISRMAVSVPQCLKRYDDGDAVAYRISVTKLGDGCQFPKSGLPYLWDTIECVLCAIDAPYQRIL